MRTRFNLPANHPHFSRSFVLVGKARYCLSTKTLLYFSLIAHRPVYWFYRYVPLIVSSYHYCKYCQYCCNCKIFVGCYADHAQSRSFVLVGKARYCLSTRTMLYFSLIASGSLYCFYSNDMVGGNGSKMTVDD